MTEKEAVSLVGMLMAAYPRFEITKATIRLYQEFLMDLGFSSAKCAIAGHIASSQYFPSISEIREAALTFAEPRIPSAAEAWFEVMEAITKTGSYGTPSFSHRSIKKAVKAIGWNNLCWSEAIGVERAHFLKIYSTFRKRDMDDANILPVLEKLGLSFPEFPALPDSSKSLAG